MPQPEKDTSTTNFVPINAHPNLDLKRLEKSWAKEYHDKPTHERELLINELHGVASRALPESPQMIASALASFQEAVDEYIPVSQKSAYFRARGMNSTYVQSEPFRLKFLRAELFDAKKAALRYIRNLDYTLETFGENALMRQLYITDLNKKERKYLKKGYSQILPFRDSVGRRIIVNLGSYGGREISPKSKERVSAYLTYVMADDETSQRIGIIRLGMPNDDATEYFQSVDIKQYNRFIGAMPIRCSGNHVCLSSKFRSWIMKASAYTFFQGETRFLSRIHIATPLECDHVLRTFGIPTEYIPRSSTGTIKDANHKSYLKMRSFLENQRKADACGDYNRYYSSSSYQTQFSVIECPEVNSFLVRRNGAAWNNPGNVRVREFLEEKLSYMKRLKEDYVSSITEEIIAQDIQILVFDEDHGWYNRITSKEEIQKQVLYIMREIRKRNRNKINVSYQSNLSVTDMFQGLTDGQVEANNSCCASFHFDIERNNPLKKPKYK